MEETQHQPGEELLFCTQDDAHDPLDHVRNPAESGESAPRGPRWVPVAAAAVALTIVALTPIIGWRAASRLLERPAAQLAPDRSSSGDDEHDRAREHDDAQLNSISPRTAHAIRAAAAAALESGQFPRVIALLEPVIRDGQATAEDYRLRAQAWTRLADLDDDPPQNLRSAADDFFNAGAEDEFAETAGLLGRWLCMNNRHREAVKAMEEFVARDRSPGVLVALSEAQAAAGDPDAARATAEQALRLAAESGNSRSQDSQRMAAKADHALAQALIRFADALEKFQPPVPNAVADADAKTEQHLIAAIAAAELMNMKEAEMWQRELDQFRETPRVAARARAQRIGRESDAPRKD